MFKISREPLKVWWPVTVRMPAEDGTELTFDIRLQYTVPVVLKDVPSGEKVAVHRPGGAQGRAERRESRRPHHRLGWHRRRSRFAHAVQCRKPRSGHEP